MMRYEWCMSSKEDYLRRSGAAHYWNQFPVDWRPMEPGDTLVGTVEYLGERKMLDGVAPVVRVRTDDGDQVNVVATWAMLLHRLKVLQPGVGDRLKIVFEGATDSGARGLKPTYQFVVQVRRTADDAPPAA